MIIRGQGPDMSGESQNEESHLQHPAFPKQHSATAWSPLRVVCGFRAPVLIAREVEGSLKQA